VSKIQGRPDVAAGLDRHDLLAARTKLAPTPLAGPL
jgi:hypothetical protein